MKALTVIHNFLIKFFLYFLPLILIPLLAANFVNIDNSYQVSNNALAVAIALPMVLWVLSGLYFLACLIFSSAFRESILMKIAFIKERDERESHIVGSAAKSTLLFMMGLTILFLALSTGKYQVTTSRTSTTYETSIDESAKEPSSETIVNVQIYNPQGESEAGRNSKPLTNLIPISATSFFALLLLTQVFSFHYFARRQQRLE